MAHVEGCNCKERCQRVLEGSANINPDTKLLELRLRRHDGETVEFCLNREWAEQIGRLGIALPPNLEREG